jgi:hypothetical protein
VVALEAAVEVELAEGRQKRIKSGCILCSPMDELGFQIVGPCIPNFFLKFESSFESERVFRESRRVRKARTLPFQLVPTLIFANFCEFSQIFANFCEFLQKLGSDITEIFPKFEKSPFPKLVKTKISEKNV